MNPGFEAMDIDKFEQNLKDLEIDCTILMPMFGRLLLIKIRKALAFMCEDEKRRIV